MFGEGELKVLRQIGKGKKILMCNPDLVRKQAGPFAQNSVGNGI